MLSKVWRVPLAPCLSSLPMRWEQTTGLPGYGCLCCAFYSAFCCFAAVGHPRKLWWCIYHGCVCHALQVVRQVTHQLCIKVTRAERVGAFHASQCGFCTPGMVVACQAAAAKASSSAAGKLGTTDHSNSEEDHARSTHGGEAQLQAVEHGLDGNLCRCTGYRPLLDVFKVGDTGASLGAFWRGWIVSLEGSCTVWLLWLLRWTNH